MSQLQHLRFDLSKKETSGFVEMLKALISRMLMDDKDISTITADFSSEEASKAIHTLKENTDSLYDNLLSSAIEFCNKDLSTDSSETGKEEEEEHEEHEDDVKLCRAMKELIREYCKASTEATRYKHLVSVLNTILCNFRSHEFKEMVTPAEMGNSELIFITNDPAVIKTDVTGTEGKPDIIATSPETLYSWFEDSKDHTWTRWRSEINKGSNPPSGLERSWLDVLQPWELKMFKERLQPERLGKAYSGQDLTAAAPGDDQVKDKVAEKESNQAANSSTATSSAKRKRESEDDIEPTASKKKKMTLKSDPPPRQSHASDAQYASAPAPSVEQLCDIDVQLASYALERLCAAWNTTHTTGISLLDTQLRLWYYDSQGCIQTHHIDILQELPLFVVMVMIFQRFDRRMWGVRDTKISSAEESKTYRIIEETEDGPQFELCGRRSFTAHVSDDLDDSSAQAKAKADAQPASENKFFKAAWPEIPRKKEGAVLDEAHRRADELLQEPFRSYVKDHIPKMDAWAELSDTSTVLIRCFLGLSTDNARVQLWMVSPILEPAQKLAPQAFWVALWEAIRCHYLLWCIGIAHCDISLGNIMYDMSTKKCILNDYDLASLMDPGTEVPDRKGYERTGTRPFMAVELLQPEGAAGPTQRRYRHDLESFCWVLLWVGACVHDGKETLTGRYANMAVGMHDEVYGKKLVLLSQLSKYATTKDYTFLQRIILIWAFWWHDDRLARNYAVVFKTPFKEESSAYFINGLVDVIEQTSPPVPIEIDWLSVEVRASLWRQYQERHALHSETQ